MRSFGAVLAGIAASLLLASAVVSGWVDRTVVETDGFVDLTSELSSSQMVQERMRDYAVDALVDEAGVNEELANTVGDTLAGIAAEALSDEDFAAAWEETVARSHEAMFSGEVPDGRLRLELAPVANLIADGSGGLVDPIDSAPVDLGGGPSADRIEQIQRVGDAAVPTAVLTAVLAVAALLLSRRRSVATVWLGVGALAAAGVVWLLSWVAVPAAGATFSADRRELVEAVAEVAGRSLRDATIPVAVGGLVLLVVGVFWSAATRSRAES